MQRGMGGGHGKTFHTHSIPKKRTFIYSHFHWDLFLMENIRARWEDAAHCRFFLFCSPRCLDGAEGLRADGVQLQLKFNKVNGFLASSSQRCTFQQKHIIQYMNRIYFQQLLIGCCEHWMKRIWLWIQRRTLWWRSPDTRCALMINIK